MVFLEDSYEEVEAVKVVAGSCAFGVAEMCFRGECLDFYEERAGSF